MAKGGDVEVEERKVTVEQLKAGVKLKTGKRFRLLVKGKDAAANGDSGKSAGASNSKSGQS